MLRLTPCCWTTPATVASRSVSSSRASRRCLGERVGGLPPLRPRARPAASPECRSPAPAPPRSPPCATTAARTIATPDCARPGSRRGYRPARLGGLEVPRERILHLRPLRLHIKPGPALGQLRRGGPAQPAPRQGQRQHDLRGPLPARLRARPLTVAARLSSREDLGVASHRWSASCSCRWRLPIADKPQRRGLIDTRVTVGFAPHQRRLVR